jgi:hypothetical protein
MSTATVNDLVLATVVTGSVYAGPVFEHAQLIGGDAAKKVALSLAIKRVTNPGAPPEPSLNLFVEIQGSADLANWFSVAASAAISLTTGFVTNHKLEGSVDGWPWLRVQYYLSSDNYSAVRSVLLTSILSVGG